jgi:phosphopantothenoylcysteine decarboxylase / phosphopantothenate---cysteine ligase
MGMVEVAPSRDVVAGRKVVICVSGGIAAYKTCRLVSALKKRGAEVRVVMTENATRFVTPLTFAALSGEPVEWDMWAERDEAGMSHISLQEFGEALLVCPATANVIGKVASGIADDLVTTAIMAAACPVGFAPAMNELMWNKPAVIENVAKLREWGYWIAGPAYGRLASGRVGKGRLVGLNQLIACVERMLTEQEPPQLQLSGVKVVITGGPTREYLDPVRFLSNPASGKMGFALAEQAAAMGADVRLVSGASATAGGDEVSGAFEVIEVTSAAEMLGAVQSNISGCDVFIGAAAVADYCFGKVAAEKMKKTDEVLSVELQRTADILRWVAESAQRPRLVVGFAAESHDVEAHAAAKLADKKLDLIVANDIVEPGSGFGGDTNRVTLLGTGDFRADLPLMSKWAVAGAVLEEVARRLGDATARLGVSSGDSPGG